MTRWPPSRVHENGVIRERFEIGRFWIRPAQKVRDPTWFGFGIQIRIHNTIWWDGSIFLGQIQRSLDPQGNPVLRAQPGKLHKMGGVSNDMWQWQSYKKGLNITSQLLQNSVIDSAKNKFLSFSAGQKKRESEIMRQFLKSGLQKRQKTTRRILQLLGFRVLLQFTFS